MLPFFYSTVIIGKRRRNIPCKRRKPLAGNREWRDPRNGFRKGTFKILSVIAQHARLGNITAKRDRRGDRQAPHAHYGEFRFAYSISQNLENVNINKKDVWHQQYGCRNLLRARQASYRNQGLKVVALTKNEAIRLSLGFLKQYSMFYESCQVQKESLTSKLPFAGSLQ